MVKPISLLYKKYVEITMSISNAFKVIMDENQMAIPILEENSEDLKSSREYRGSQEQSDDETVPDDVDRSISEKCSRLKDSTQLEDLKEMIMQSHFRVINTPR